MAASRERSVLPDPEAEAAESDSPRTAEEICGSRAPPAIGAAIDARLLRSFDGLARDLDHAIRTAATLSQQHDAIATCLLIANALCDWPETEEPRSREAFGFRVLRSMPCAAESLQLRGKPWFADDGGEAVTAAGSQQPMAVSPSGSQPHSPSFSASPAAMAESAAPTHRFCQPLSLVLISSAAPSHAPPPTSTPPAFPSLAPPAAPTALRASAAAPATLTPTVNARELYSHVKAFLAGRAGGSGSGDGSAEGSGEGSGERSGEEEGQGLWRVVRACGVESAGELSGVVDERGWTAMHVAARLGDSPVLRALLRMGMPVGVCSKGNATTPLHVAAYGGHVDCMLLLAQHGADVHARTAGGWTPLHNAASQQQWEAVRRLAQQGIDPAEVEAAGANPKADKLPAHLMAHAVQIVREEHARRAGQGEEMGHGFGEVVGVALRDGGTAWLKGRSCMGLPLTSGLLVPPHSLFPPLSLPSTPVSSTSLPCNMCHLPGSDVLMTSSIKFPNAASFFLPHLHTLLHRTPPHLPASGASIEVLFLAPSRFACSTFICQVQQLIAKQSKLQHGVGASVDQVRAEAARGDGVGHAVRVDAQILQVRKGGGQLKTHPCQVMACPYININDYLERHAFLEPLLQHIRLLVLSEPDSQRRRTMDYIISFLPPHRQTLILTTGSKPKVRLMANRYLARNYAHIDL
ncbi:unnamed protein product [Closterium sp. Yama58-4]|nr:unnamed protein product [Closterium sp. Yama58-4]